MNRPGLQKLLRLCRAGKVDYIITKSIKRFSRNTLDLLVVLRELQSLGIDVYFEVEKIHLKDPKSMLLITIYASLAQDESENMSGNIKWGIRHGFESGTSGWLNMKCYGYKRGNNGRLIPKEDEAETVRKIFKWRDNGLSLRSISKRLQQLGVPSPRGNTTWHSATLQKILSNERYIGDVLLQKTYTPDFLTGKRIKNSGQMKRYYIHNTHEGIIPKELFERVNKQL